MTARTYDARQRRARGEVSRRETRRRIRTAAHQLFLEKGYAGTTVKDIATAAGVGAATIYAIPWTKRDILMSVRDVDLAGDDEPVALVDQDWTAALPAEPDPDRQLQLLVHKMCVINARVEPILGVMRAAAGSDPQIAADHAEDESRRYQTQSALLALLTQWRPRAELPGPHQDIFWSLISPFMHHQLGCERGWDLVTIEMWLQQVLATSVLERVAPNADKSETR